MKRYIDAKLNLEQCKSNTSILINLLENPYSKELDDKLIDHFVLLYEFSKEDYENYLNLMILKYPKHGNRLKKFIKNKLNI